MTAEVYDPGPPDVAPDRAPAAGPGGTAMDRLLHLLLPAPCLGCGRPLPAAGAPLGLCAPCRGRLRPLAGRPDVCPACARALPGLSAATRSPAADIRRLPPGRDSAPLAGRCGRCLASPPACERLLALWLYQPPLDAVIGALKFRRLDYLGRHLAEAAAAGLEPELRRAWVETVVPVPLHWRRRLARGFNQAERIARPLAERLGLPHLAALTRPRPAPPQSRLGRGARLANAQGAFRARRANRIAGRRILLVDDVTTTGATLEAAATALRAAGAAAVVALVAGRTPEPG